MDDLNKKKPSMEATTNGTNENNTKAQDDNKHSQNKPVINSLFKLNSSYSLCLEYIFNNPRCNRWQLGAYLETGYAPDLVQYVRKAGIRIITEMADFTKRNGKKTRIGLYSIHPKSLKDAKNIIESMRGDNG